jgi:hypothetical protein
MQWPKGKGQRTKYDLQNTTQKTKDRATRTPLKYMGELGRVRSSCSTNGNVFSRTVQDIWKNIKIHYSNLLCIESSSQI